MGLLTVAEISRAGTALTLVAATSPSNWFPNTGRTYAHVRNGSASPITVTIDSVRRCDQGFDHDEIVSVPAGGDRLLGPFPPERFNNADGRVTISYSAVTTVTVGAFNLP